MDVVNKMLSCFMVVILSFSAFETSALTNPSEAYGAEAPAYGFSDVSGDEWFAIDEVLGYATEHGIISGYADGRLGAYDDVTRGQVAVILHRLAGEPDAQATDFTDVDYGEYYGPAVRWARSAGVINGYWDEGAQAYLTFGPNDPVTREQLAAMLANYAREVEGIVTETDGALLNAMPDAGAVDGWARESVGWAMDSGLISGVVEGGGTYVRPLATAQRCAMAKMASALDRDVLPPEIDPNAVQIMEYKDGVIEVDEYEVVSSGIVRVPTEKASGISLGAIVAFKPTESCPTGCTLRVTERTAEQSTVLLSGERAELVDVYKKLSIQGITEATATDIQLADGVTMVDESSGLSLANSEQEIDFGEVKFMIDESALKGTCLEGSEVSVKFKPKVDYKVDKTLSSLNELYVALEYEKKVEISTSNTVGEYSHKLFSAPLATPVPGCTVEISAWLNISVDGSATVTTTTNYKSGFSYKNGRYQPIRKGSVELSAELSATLKAGVDCTVSIDELLASIVDVSLDAGAKAEGKETVRTAGASGFRCCNVELSLYLDLAIAKHDCLARALGLEWNKGLADAKLAELHWENGNRVKKCTWENDDKDTIDHQEQALAYQKIINEYRAVLNSNAVKNPSGSNGTVDSAAAELLKRENPEVNPYLFSFCISGYDFKYAFIDINNDSCLDLIVAEFANDGKEHFPDPYCGVDVWTLVNGTPYRVTWGCEENIVTIRENGMLLTGFNNGWKGNGYALKCLRLNPSERLSPVMTASKWEVPSLLDDEINYEQIYATSLFDKISGTKTLTYPDGTRVEVDSDEGYPESFQAIVNQYPIKTDIDWISL